MTDIEFFKQLFLARLHAPSHFNESPKQFADRCCTEALAAWEEYESISESMFDAESGGWVS